MARIAGINIPLNKHIVIALTSIYGIGHSRAKKICEAAGIAFIGPTPESAPRAELPFQPLQIFRRTHLRKFHAASRNNAPKSRRPVRPSAGLYCPGK